MIVKTRGMFTDLVHDATRGLEYEAEYEVGLGIDDVPQISGSISP